MWLLGLSSLQNRVISVGVSIFFVQDSVNGPLSLNKFLNVHEQISEESIPLANSQNLLGDSILNITF